MIASTLILCDAHGCESRCELSFKADLRNPDKALKDRGWAYRPSLNGKPPRHLCPTCAPRVHVEGWTTIEEEITSQEAPVASE